MKLRVLHIIWNAKFGGIEKLVFDLAQNQNNGKHIEAAVMLAKSEGELLSKFEKGNFDCQFLNLKSGFSLSWNTYQKALHIFKEYDILHLHFFNPLLAHTMRISNKPIVYTEHGNFGFGRKKKFTDGILLSLKKRFLNGNNLAITFNSHFTKRHAEELYDLSKHSNKSIVYNGIDLITPSEKPNSNNQKKEIEKLETELAGKFVVGTSSRFVGFKKIDRLIAAFEKFSPIENSILLLVGDGILKIDLQNQVKELNLENKVIFTGFVEDTRAYQKLMDVCVFPSISEPFGLVAVETLSLGKPTLVYNDGGGLTEIVGGISQDDIVKNELELINRIEYHRAKKPSDEELNKRKEYTRSFSIQEMTKKMETIYKKML